MDNKNKLTIENGINKMATFIGEPSKAHSELSGLLEDFSDEEKGEQKGTFVPGAEKIRGVKGKHITKISTEIGKHLKKRDDETSLAFLKYLWETEIHEERKIVCKVIGKLIKRNPQLWTDFIIDILPDIDNWSICDTLATQGLEPQSIVEPDRTLR